MRRGLLLSIITVIILIPCLLAGCGIPQEQYDAVLADLDTTRQEVQSLGEELEAAESEILELTANLNEAEEDLEEARAENMELAEELENNQSQLMANREMIEELEDKADVLEIKISELGGRIPNLVYDTYMNNEVGFSLMYPQGWDLSVDMFLDGQGAAIFIDEITRANIVISSEIFIEPMTIDEYFDATVEQISQIGLDVLGEEEIMLSNRQAIRCISYLETEDVMQTMVVLVDGQRGWMVGCTAPARDFMYYAHTFNEVIDSLNIWDTGA